MERRANGADETASEAELEAWRNQVWAETVDDPTNAVTRDREASERHQSATWQLDPEDAA